jgi:hypothetical protein
VDTSILPKDHLEVLPDDTLETHYAGLERMRPHGCYEGFVYIGHIVEDESGEPVEEIERVPCRRCNPENL